MPYQIQTEGHVPGDRITETLAASTDYKTMDRTSQVVEYNPKSGQQLAWDSMESGKPLSRELATKLGQSISSGETVSAILGIKDSTRTGYAFIESGTTPDGKSYVRHMIVQDTPDGPRVSNYGDTLDEPADTPREQLLQRRFADLLVTEPGTGVALVELALKAPGDEELQPVIVTNIRATVEGCEPPEGLLAEKITAGTRIQACRDLMAEHAMNQAEQNTQTKPPHKPLGRFSVKKLIGVR